MYTAKVKGLLLTKTYKCKGHTIIKENGCTMLILDNEERVFIPASKIIHFSDGWFKMELSQANKDSQGKADIDHGAKP